MDVREIKKLISLMNENGLARLEVEEEGKRYLLEKEGAASTGGTPVFVGGAPAGVATPVPPTVPVSQAPPAETAPAEAAKKTRPSTLPISMRLLRITPSVQGLDLPHCPRHLRKSLIRQGRLPRGQIPLSHQTKRASCAPSPKKRRTLGTE